MILPAMYAEPIESIINKELPVASFPLKDLDLATF